MENKPIHKRVYSDRSISVMVAACTKIGVSDYLMRQKYYEDLNYLHSHF